MSPASSVTRSGLPVPLGPFELTSVLGAGAMGEVWAGRHRTRDLRIAAKVLTGHAAALPAYRAAFRNEVQAVARLDHPCIVQIYDHGELTEAEGDALGGLPPGTPYLVMELAEGPTLSSLCGSIAWPELRAVLLCLLDALAHAHARGVIHRDVKPGNVLLGTAGAGLAITDFGLAHGGERHVGPSAAWYGGTPAFMAPEQWEGRAAELGPWTDLYGVGGLAWTLASGSPPFGTPTAAELRTAHLGADPPPLRAARPVPEGLEAWLRTLLEKSPRQRYRRAADAAWALLQLEPGSTEPPTRPRVKLPVAAGARAVELPHPTLTSMLLDAPPGERPARPPPQPSSPERREGPTLRVAIPAAGRGERREGDSITVRSPPPVPRTWRRADAARPVPAELGLGLYGLRPIPLVDRESERDVLWQTLQEVHARGAPRAVILEGPSGCGKSRLAEWLCERAHECGAATPLRAVHSPIATPLDGLAAMIARHLRLLGLPRETTLAQLSELLAGPDAADALPLTELLAPSETADAPRPLRFSGAAERHALVRRFIARVAAERPAVLWLDDVQWGADALQFVRTLQAPGPPLPVLLLLTARDEALAEREAEAGLLRAVGADASARRIAVGPLPDRFRGELVQRLLGLHGDLASAVEERTAGNPLFAVQLVGDWVHRGVLVPSEEGYRLRDGADVGLPEDLRQVWSARLDELLAARPPADASALELAAVLGQEVDAAEWRDACSRAGLAPADDLVGVLVRRRLAVAGEPGVQETFAFVNGQLRECLLGRAGEAGRLAGHHRACGAMLRTRFGPQVAQRLGEHLLRAGASAEAIQPLLDGAREQLRSGDARVAERLLAEREAALRLAGVPEEDPRWADGFLERARCALTTLRLPEANLHGERLLAASSLWPAHAAPARLVLGRVANLRGDVGIAILRFGEALEEATQRGERRLAEDARRHLADVLAEAGQVERAAELYGQAAAGFEQEGDAAGQGHCLGGLAWIASQRGRPSRARDLLGRARGCFERAGDRVGVGRTIHDLAEIDRQEGRLDEAEAGYDAAREAFLQVGQPREVQIGVNLALVQLARGNVAEARSRFEALLPALQEIELAGFATTAHLGAAACAAEAAEWPAVDEHLRAARALLEQSRFAETEFALLLERVGATARSRGQRDRAREALGLAAEQLRRIGREEAAARLDEQLRAL